MAGRHLDGDSIAHSSYESSKAVQGNELVTQEDTMADYANRMNEFNRQMMETRGQAQPAAALAMPPTPPVNFNP